MQRGSLHRQIRARGRMAVTEAVSDKLFCSRNIR